MARPKIIDDLSNEMLVEIFIHVSFNDLVFSIQRVCSRWKEVAQDSLLWRDHIYKPHLKEKDDDIANMLALVPKLRTFNLSERGVEPIVLRAIVQNCPYIKKLIFNDYQTLNITFLKDLSMNCSNIEYLHVPHNVLYKLGQVKVIGQFSKLKHLIFGGWADPDRKNHLEPLADGCPILESIDLKDKVVTKKGLEYFLKKKKDQLHTLCIKWGTSDAQSTVPLITMCTKVETLYINCYCDTQIGGGFKPLRSLKTITSLTLWYLNDLKIRNITDLFRNQGMKQLKELKIHFYYKYENVLGDVIVKNCPQLKLLSLCECINMSDESLRNIHTLRNLESVNLSGTQISYDGVNFLKQCSKLKYLNLDDCRKLTESSMKLLTEFPNLQTLILDLCSIKGLQMHLIPSHLVHLSVLSVNYCLNIDQHALKQLKTEKPNLVVYDLTANYKISNSSEDED